MSASSIDQGENSGVTEAAMRRALARARDGKLLDQAEATILLHARGADLQALLQQLLRVRGIISEWRAFWSWMTSRR